MENYWLFWQTKSLLPLIAHLKFSHVLIAASLKDWPLPLKYSQMPR